MYFIDNEQKEPQASGHGNGNSIFYGLSTINLNSSNCSSNVAMVNLKLQGLEHWAYFAICDGHEGEAFCEHVSQHLIDFIFTPALVKQLEPLDKCSDSEMCQQLIEEATEKAFVKMDEYLLKRVLCLECTHENVWYPSNCLHHHSLSNNSHKL